MAARFGTNVLFGAVRAAWSAQGVDPAPRRLVSPPSMPPAVHEPGSSSPPSNQSDRMSEGRPYADRCPRRRWGTPRARAGSAADGLGQEKRGTLIDPGRSVQAVVGSGWKLTGRSGDGAPMERKASTRRRSHRRTLEELAERPRERDPSSRQ